MFRIAKNALVVFMITMLLIAPLASTAQAEEFFERQAPSGGMMIFDVVIIRPIGIVATAVGSVFYVITLPFSLLGGNSGEALDALIMEPAAYTFKRPIGEFPERTL